MTNDEIMNATSQLQSSQSKQYANEFANYMQYLDKIKWIDDNGDEMNPYDPDGFWNSAHNESSQLFATNSMNYILANLQNQWNLDQWKRQISWDSPVNQVERFKEAGLSAAAAAEAATGFQAPALQSANLANQQMSATHEPMSGMFSALGMIKEFAMTLSNLRRQNAESELLEQEAGVNPEILLTNLDVKKQTLKDMVQRYDAFAKLFPHSEQSARNAAEASDYLPRQAAVNWESQQENLNLAKQRYAFLEKMNEQEYNKMLNDIKIQGKAIQEADARIKELNSRVELNKKLGKSADADANLKEIVAATEEKKQKEQDLRNSLILFGNPEDQAGRFAAQIASGNMTLQEGLEYYNDLRAIVLSSKHTFSGLPVLKNYYNLIINPGQVKNRELDQDLFRTIMNNMPGMNLGF